MLLNNIVYRLKVWNKLKSLISIAVEDNEHILTEALYLIQPLFGNADLSLFHFEKSRILASTVLNEDILDGIKVELDSIDNYERIEDIMIFEKRKMHRLRPGICSLALIPLYSAVRSNTILAVEFYSKKVSLSFVRLEELIKVLSIVTGYICLADLEHVAMRTDGATMLPNREALIEKLDDLIANNKNYSFALITIANVSWMNEHMGVLETERLVRAVGIELGRLMPENVYRVSRTKYGLIMSSDTGYASFSLEGIVERITALNRNIATVNIVCQLADSAYETLFVCESHIKHCEWDVVTVVSGAVCSGDEEDFKELKEIYFLETEIQKNLTVETEDNKEIEKQESKDEEEFIFNDIFDFYEVDQK